MSGFAFVRDGGEWACEDWRALERALYRWVRAHGGSVLLATTAAWASRADGDGDAALPLAGANRLGMAPLSPAQIDALRAEPMVADVVVSDDVAHDDKVGARPFVIDRALRFYLWRNHAQERAAAAAIRARCAGQPAHAERAEAVSIGAERTKVDSVESDLDALFHGERNSDVEAQRGAVRGVIGRRLFVLTGAPGTGKTTTVLRMLLMLQRRAQRPLSMQIAAPTGKAAQRLAQSLRRGKTQLRASGLSPGWLALIDAVPDGDAQTVHRLLGYQPWRNGFRRNAHDPVAADVVVVDEASMIDLGMLRSLLDAVKPDATLILVGDADQLTSVATGSVLMDIVTALETAAGGAVARLQHSFRAERALVAVNEAVRHGDRDAVGAAIAAADGAVVVRAVETAPQLRERLGNWANVLANESVLRQRVPVLAQDAVASAARAQAVGVALGALARRQLLCALREGPFGALTVNGCLERLLRNAWNVPENTEWYAGRPIMITHNDYAAGLFNGDVGLCLADADGRLQVWFETAQRARAGADSSVRAFAPNTLPLHETAFAITIHKSQGSEYDDVAVLLPPEADNRILSRQLLYTALSRARRNVEIWASAAAIEAAIGAPVRRVGGLAERIGAADTLSLTGQGEAEDPPTNLKPNRR